MKRLILFLMVVGMMTGLCFGDLIFTENGDKIIWPGGEMEFLSNRITFAEIDLGGTPGISSLGFVDTLIFESRTDSGRDFITSANTNGLTISANDAIVLLAGGGLEIVTSNNNDITINPQGAISQVIGDLAITGIVTAANLGGGSSLKLLGSSANEFLVVAQYIDVVQQGGANKFELRLSGTFTGGSDTDYELEIDGTSPDTFKWRKDTGGGFGAYTTEVAVPNGFVELDEAIVIAFLDSNSDVFVIGDDYSFTAVNTPDVILNVDTQTPLVTTAALDVNGTLEMNDNFIQNVGYILFDADFANGSMENRLSWNDDDGTLNLGMKGGVVNQQIGLEQLVRGKNATGSGTTNGKPVRISSSSGSPAFPEFDFSDADDLTAAGSIGLFTEDVNTNALGYVTTYGYVRDMDTSGTPVSESWSAADRIYVSNDVGALTNVAPTGTERIIFIGIVIRAHATEGIIWVNPINVSYLSELSGVTITSVANNDILEFDSGSGIWVNTDSPTFAALTVTGATSLNGALDMNGNAITDTGNVSPVDATKELGDAGKEWAKIHVDGPIGVQSLPFFLDINVGSSFDYMVNIADVVFNFDGSGAGTGTFTYKTATDEFEIDTDTTVTGIGTFNEVNIGSVGGTGTLLSVGTSATGTVATTTLVNISSDITDPTSNDIDAGLVAEPYWTDSNADQKFGIVANVLLDGAAATTTVTGTGLFGGVQQITDTSVQPQKLTGLEFSAIQSSNFAGHVAPPVGGTVQELKALKLGTSLGSAGKTISDRANVTVWGGEVITTLAGTYNSTSHDGTAYGLYAQTLDAGIDSTAGGFDVNAYGVYIDAAASKALTDGDLFSWSLFSVNDVPSAHVGNLRLGDTTIPTVAQLEVEGVSRFGDPEQDYSEFEADGTLEFNEAATVWDDYVTPLSRALFGGAANDPTLTKVADDGAGSGGVWAFVFGDGDEVLACVQMPHSWKEGGTIYPHIHFFTMTDVDPSDNFDMDFEYWWADIGEDFPANTTLVTTTHATGVNSQFQHQAGNLTAAGIDGTGHTISSVLHIRIERQASAGDNYAGGVVISDFDIHFEKDTVGSRGITSK